MTISQEIVEIFEDFLEKHGVNIPNEDRDMDGDPDAAIIYGMDYAELCDNVTDTLQRWVDRDVTPMIDHILDRAVTER